MRLTTLMKVGYIARCVVRVGLGVAVALAGVVVSATVAGQGSMVVRTPAAVMMSATVVATAPADAVSVLLLWRR